MGDDDENHWQVLDEDKPGYLPRDDRKLYYNCYLLYPEVANIFVIDSLEDLQDLLYTHRLDTPGWTGSSGVYYQDEYLDFEELARDYDALHLTVRGQWKTRMTRPNLYGWDVESTLWFRWKFNRVEFLGRLGFSECDMEETEKAKRKLLGLLRRNPYRRNSDKEIRSLQRAYQAGEPVLGKLRQAMLRANLGDPQWNQGPWTQIKDMHSNGTIKLPPKEYFYIQADEEQAINIFHHRFGRHPHWVTCDCCGSDYSVTGDGNLFQATGLERGCDYDEDAEVYLEQQDMSRTLWAQTTPYRKLDEYVHDDKVVIITRLDMTSEELAIADSQPS
jgi:hypothetical protein